MDQRFAGTNLLTIRCWTWEEVHDIVQNDSIAAFLHRVITLHVTQSQV